MNKQSVIREAMLSVMLGEASLSQAAHQYQISKRSLYNALRLANQAPQKQRQQLLKARNQLMANVTNIDLHLAQQAI